MFVSTTLAPDGTKIVDYNFHPYPEQNKIISAYLDPKIIYMVLVCHRRLGKTTTCLFIMTDWVQKVLTNQEVDFPRACYVAPTKTQARKIIWSKMCYFFKTIPWDAR